MLLDKAGTLATVQPSVIDVVRAAVNTGQTADSLHQLAAAVERGSEHPLGEAIVNEAAARKLALPAAERFAAIAVTRKDQQSLLRHELQSGLGC